MAGRGAHGHVGVLLGHAPLLLGVRRHPVTVWLLWGNTLNGEGARYSACQFAADAPLNAERQHASGVHHARHAVRHHAQVLTAHQHVCALAVGEERR